MQYESVQNRDGILSYSPSDLSEYLGCVHATHLQLEIVNGLRKKSFATSDYAELIFRKGDEHEQTYLAHLQAAGPDQRPFTVDHRVLHLVESEGGQALRHAVGGFKDMDQQLKLAVRLHLHDAGHGPEYLFAHHH